MDGCSSTASSESGPWYHILLVEDNPGDVGLIRRALAGRCWRTLLHVTRDAMQALDFLCQCRPAGALPCPDLILVDLNLPKMDGCELLRRIRQDATRLALPVIVFSSSRAEADVLRSYANGANCYVTKPLDLDQYLAVIGSVQQYWLTLAQFLRNTANE